MVKTVGQEERREGTGLKATSSPADCTHEQQVLTRKRKVNGAPMYVMQCQECGQNASNQVAAAVAMRDGFTPWDEELAETGRTLRNAQYERDRNTREREALERQREWAERYQAHLLSQKWQKLRELVFRRSDGICEGCGVRPAVQVHHLSYEHVGEEFLWELAAVCMTCHERIHPHMRDGKRTQS